MSDPKKEKIDISNAAMFFSQWDQGSSQISIGYFQSFQKLGNVKITFPPISCTLSNIQETFE